jgi:hypothetical protein
MMNHTAAEPEFVVWHRASIHRGPRVCRRWTRRLSQPSRDLAELLSRDILFRESGEVVVLAAGIDPCEIEVVK